MSIKADCECGRILKLKDSLVGKKVRCPECSAVVTVPSQPDRSEQHQKRRGSTRRRPKRSRDALSPSKRRNPPEHYGQPDDFGEDLYDVPSAAAPARKKRKKKTKSNTKWILPVVLFTIGVTIVGGAIWIVRNLPSMVAAAHAEANPMAQTDDYGVTEESLSFPHNRHEIGGARFFIPSSETVKPSADPNQLAWVTKAADGKNTIILVTWEQKSAAEIKEDTETFQFWHKQLLISQHGSLTSREGNTEGRNKWFLSQWTRLGPKRYSRVIETFVFTENGLLNVIVDTTYEEDSTEYIHLLECAKATIGIYAD